MSTNEPRTASQRGQVSPFPLWFVLLVAAAIALYVMYEVILNAL